jgi:hypothetical protein
MERLRMGPAYASRLLAETNGSQGTATDLGRIALALNLEVREVDAGGFDGALVRAKSVPIGAIIVRRSILEASRKNFTIAHEIGHFLMPGHEESGGVCASDDIGNWTRPANVLEREADEFAAELLMPEASIRPFIESSPPSLGVMEEIAGKFRSSFSSVAWRYCDLTRERCAVVWSARGQIQWSKHSKYFGYRLRKSGAVRQGSFAFGCTARSRGPSLPKPVSAALWIQSKNLPQGEVIWEQSKALPNYDSVLSLLWIKKPIRKAGL